MGVLILRHWSAWRNNANARLRRMNDYLRIDLCIAQTPVDRRFGLPGHPRLDEDPRRYNGRGVPPRWKLTEIPGRRSAHEWTLPQIVRACRRRRGRLTECRCCS